MKKIIITQSNYIPWRGFFDSIALADEIILFDDMQYTKRDWRNRNKIKTANGAKWISVPVKVKGKFFQSIYDTEIAEDNWAEKHWNIIHQNYRKAPCFKEVESLVKGWYEKVDEMSNLSHVNTFLTQEIMNYLGIKTQLLQSSEFTLSEGKTQRLVDLCIERNADLYYTGPAAKSYIELDLFEKENIEVEYFDFSGYEAYPQLHGEFDGQVSILDLIFNCGSNSADHMKFVKK